MHEASINKASSDDDLCHLHSRLRYQNLRGIKMVTRVFPKQFDNDFIGYKFSLWIFYGLTALTLWRSQHHLFAPDGGAESIASIPLSSYSTAASDTIVGVFALWGLSQLIIGLIYLIACIKYKSMIPLLYLLAALEYFVRWGYVGVFKSIETAGTAPGSVINLPFMIAFVALFFFSIGIPKKSR